MKSKVLAIFLSVGFVFSCSTNRAFLEYSDFRGEYHIKSAAWKGEDLGVVRADVGGAVWDDCTGKAREAIRQMIREAENMKANAIGDIRWLPDDQNLTDPHCKKRWGWVALWPFLLTPLFMSATVEAHAYKVKNLPDAKSVYLIPQDTLAKNMLVERVLRETR